MLYCDSSNVGLEATAVLFLLPSIFMLFSGARDLRYDWQTIVLDGNHHCYGEPAVNPLGDARFRALAGSVFPREVINPDSTFQHLHKLLKNKLAAKA